MPVETQEKYFTETEISLIQNGTLPYHVAIIMDGNRRFGKKMGVAGEGHFAGAKNLVDIVQAAIQLKIKVLTVYGLSTENRFREASELSLLFKIMESYLKEYCEKMRSLGVRFHTIGDLSPLPTSLKNALAHAKEQTANGNVIDFVVAINYGSRNEITRAFLALHKAILKGQEDPDLITEEDLSRYLDTSLFKDPDLLIRTSGEARISNFLLWQLAYSEIYLTDTLWPLFSPKHLLEAILDYQKRDRRIGK